MCDYVKVDKTIRTCKTLDQLEVAKKLIPLLYQKSKNDADNFFLLLHADLTRDRLTKE